MTHQNVRDAAIKARLAAADALRVLVRLDAIMKFEKKS
jgi:hypothetical protein